MEKDRKFPRELRKEKTTGYDKICLGINVKWKSYTYIISHLIFKPFTIILSFIFLSRGMEWIRHWEYSEMPFFLDCPLNL